MSINPNFPMPRDVEEEYVADNNEKVEAYIKFDLERWCIIERDISEILKERVIAKQYDFQSLRLLNALRLMHEINNSNQKKGG